MFVRSEAEARIAVALAALRADAVTYLTGPRGGTYYISASGRKVYGRKSEAPAREKKAKSEPKAPAEKKPRRTSEEARVARNTRARERRAEKKLAAAKAKPKPKPKPEPKPEPKPKPKGREKKQKADPYAEDPQVVAAREARHQEREKRLSSEREYDAALAKSRGGPQTRKEAQVALEKHVGTLSIGKDVADHEVVNAYHELKAYGVEHAPLSGLQLGVPADSVALQGDSGRYILGSIRMNANVHDATPEQRVAQATARRDAAKLTGTETSDVVPLGTHSAPGARGYSVRSGRGQDFTDVLVHEFGHHIHMHNGDGKGGQADEIVKRTFTKHHQERKAVSEYGGTNHAEFFAEAHLAYRRRHSEMKAAAPNAFKMVEDVLTLRGIPL